ncbi:hypothetical protein TWF718_002855 [Orbilia javanica]|uniref:Uncharacterized protein n=1 Tax=Orbilia javanica TaxID=47235 RepID=A0AAN8MF41_9PEZI
MLFFEFSKTYKPPTGFQPLIHVLISLALCAIVNGQGNDGDKKFPSPGARRQTLPLGYGPHILASNHDWIQDEANLARTELQRKQAEAGLYDVDPNTVQWADERRVVITTKQKWLDFEKDIGADDPETHYDEPLFNLLVLGKEFTQIQSNVHRLFYTINSAIKNMDLKESPELFEVFDFLCIIAMIRLHNSFIGFPKLYVRFVEVFQPDSPVIATAATLVDPRFRPRFEEMVERARKFVSPGDYEAKLIVTPGALDRGSILYSGLVVTSRTEGIEKTTTKGEKTVLLQLFDVEQASDPTDKTLFINDSQFLLLWNIIFFTFAKLDALFYIIWVSVGPRLAFYRQTYGELMSPPVREIKRKEPGLFDRRLLGSGEYIKEKYGDSLIGFSPIDPIWNTWIEAKDPKYFADIVGHLGSELTVEINVVLAAMMDCMADIAVDLHASGIPASSSFGPVPDFAIPSFLRSANGTLLNLDLEFLKKYPEWEPFEYMYLTEPIVRPRVAVQKPENQS